MGPFVVGMQLATGRSRGEQGQTGLCQGKFQGFFARNMGSDGSQSVRSLRLHLKGLTRTPVLGTVQGQGSIWETLGRLKDPADS